MRAPIRQHVKMFRQVTAPPGHVKERVYTKLVNQDGYVQRYGGLKAIKKDETIFAAYDKLGHENRSLGADQRSHGVRDSDLWTSSHVCVP